MPAVTDLTFAQLDTALKTILGTPNIDYIENVGDEFISLNLTRLIGTQTLENEGVIKTFSILL